MKTSQDSLSRIPDPPSGFRALIWRLPIWFYRLGLGRLFGRRALMLTHTGRNSGKKKYAVLEVIKYDSENNIHYVASGFGKKSDWYKNIKKNPQVTIQSGGEKFAANARILTTEDSLIIFRGYMEKYPNAIKNLVRLIGYQVGTSEGELLDFLRLIPIISFQPTQFL